MSRWTAGSAATLREARNRRKVDLSEVEAATKIRVRYLRAIENEEWDVLPGGAYTRGFIRTYASLPRPRRRAPGRRLPRAASNRGSRAAEAPRRRRRPASPRAALVRRRARPRWRGRGDRASRLIAVVAIVVELAGGGGSDTAGSRRRQARAHAGTDSPRPKPATQPVRRASRCSLTATRRSLGLPARRQGQAAGRRPDPRSRSRRGAVPLR